MHPSTFSTVKIVQSLLENFQTECMMPDFL